MSRGFCCVSSGYEQVPVVPPPAPEASSAPDHPGGPKLANAKLGIAVDSTGSASAHTDTAGLKHATKYPVRRPKVRAPSRAVRAPTHLKSLEAVDLRPDCPPVYNQGHLGSCTANSIGFAYEFNQVPDEAGEKKFPPSRLFIYYNERAMEKTIADDAGAQISDGIKSVMTTGVCPESMWPYGTTEQFTQGTITTDSGETEVDPNILIDGASSKEWPLWAQKPSDEAYYEAQYHKATAAHAVDQ